MSNLFRNVGVAASIALAGLAWASPSLADEPYYKGKTVTVLVGYGPGGSSDLSARAIVDNLSQYVPGNPEMIVKNMTGGGGVKAFNYLYERAKPDGLTLQFGASTPLDQVVGAPGLRARFDELTIAGATTSPGGLAMYIRTDAVPGGFKKAADIVKAPELKLGGIGPGAIPDVLGRLTLMALDTPFRYIPGYKGSLKVVNAVRGGEANVGVAPLSTYRQVVEPNMVKSGEAAGVMYWGLHEEDGTIRKNELIPELPTFEEVYEEIYDKAPSGVAYEALKFNAYILSNASHLMWGPPGMPKEAVDAIREGMKKVISDPNYIALQTKIAGYPQVYVEPEKAEKVMKSLTMVSPELKKFMTDFYYSGKSQ